MQANNITGATTVSSTTFRPSSTVTFSDAGSNSSSLVGNNYPGSETSVTYMDLTSSTNKFDDTKYHLPHRVYYFNSTSLNFYRTIGK